MNSSPLVSVIIPTYNNEDCILKSILSILKQDYKYLECVVVDDGSTDNTLGVLDELIRAQKITYVKQENLGVSKARNKGIKNCNGNYLLFLDADDILLDGAIVGMVRVILSTNSDFCVGLEKQIDLEQSFPYKEYMLANLVSRWWPVSAVLVKKNNVLWNENLKTWEVVQYFADILLGGFNGVICPKEVTKINHDYREGRATFVYNHYNATNTFNFFFRLKQNFDQKAVCDFQVSEAIEKILLSNLYTIYRNDRKLPGDLPTNLISLKHLENYNWYKTFGLSGFCKFLGLKTGIKLFFAMNKILKGPIDRMVDYWR